MIRPLSLLTVMVWLATTASGIGAPPDARSISGEMFRDAFSVFSLTEAQERSAAAIIAKFPDLRQDATMAKIEFDEAFGPAIRAVDDFLTQNSSAEFDWPSLREKLEAEIGQLDFSQMSRQQALDYIETIRKRTKGDGPQRIYRVLMAFHPVYAEKPHMELVNGYKKEYTSDGAGKSLGLKISIEYPRSWEAAEGRRPHILQKFESPDSSASAMIYVNDIPLPARLSSDQDNLDYLSSREYIEKEMPGAVFLSRSKTTIAGKPSAICDAILTRSAPAGDITVRTRMYFILHKQKIVTFTVDTAADGLKSRDEMEARFRNYEMLFDLMATSIDFYDKYD